MCVLIFFLLLNFLLLLFLFLLLHVFYFTDGLFYLVSRPEHKLLMKWGSDLLNVFYVTHAEIICFTPKCSDQNRDLIK